MSAPRVPLAPTEEDATRSGRTSDPAHDSSPPVEGDRGIPSVNRVRSVQSRVSGALAMALIGTLGGGLLFWYYSGAATRQARLEASAQAAARSRAAGEMLLPPLGRIDAPVPVRADPTTGAARDTSADASSFLLGEAPPLPALDAGPHDASPYQYAAYAATPTPAEHALARRLSGPVFAQGSGGTTAPAEFAPPAAAMSAGDPRSEAPAQAEGAGSLGTLLRPNATAAVSARVLPTRRLLLPKGAFIDCTLETAIDSSLPGMTTCITAADTFGADGRVVVLERGTKLIGETRGEASRGSSRLFVLWSEARTPTGVVVPLASPGTDELGRAGVTGTVDRHFWTRFGAAILISVIDGAVQAGVEAARSGEGDAIVVTPSGSRDVMTEVLKETVAIAPTIRKPQGDRIQVLVARDLDFRSVYELEPVRAAGS